MDRLDLLKRPEGKTLEFKRDLSSHDGVLRSLVAFANTSGGAVLIGVEDRTRHVRGVKEPLDLEERLATSSAITSCRGWCPSWKSSLGAEAMFWPSRCTPARFGRTTYGGRAWTEASTSGSGPPIGGPTVS